MRWTPRFVYMTAASSGEMPGGGFVHDVGALKNTQIPKCVVVEPIIRVSVGPIYLIVFLVCEARAIESA